MFQGSVTEMVRVCQGRCPAVTRDTAWTNELTEQCHEKARLPSDFSKSVLVEQAGPELYNKLKYVTRIIAYMYSSTVMFSCQC